MIARIMHPASPNVILYAYARGGKRSPSSQKSNTFTESKQKQQYPLCPHGRGLSVHTKELARHNPFLELCTGGQTDRALLYVSFSPLLIFPDADDWNIPPRSQLSPPLPSLDVHVSVHSPNSPGQRWSRAFGSRCLWC